ncbi:MAG: cation diffusion facilitator family transporter [Bacteroidetes bacterium]|nr:cation diffusion facilitator family transporter [Bacteroidota bacterium]MCZ2133056.1 cation diffusion facilitator family transporter [Bacteroidota bacterium]
MQQRLSYYLQRFSAITRRWFAFRSPTFIPRISLLLCVTLAGAGIALGASENSLSIATNGLIALVDVLNSMLFIAAVDRATRDADATFNYGYGKYESLAMLTSASLLTFVALYVLVHAIGFMDTTAHGERPWILLTFSLGSGAAMYGMAAITRRYANKFQYQMLHYDAALWRLDSFMELIVSANILIGIILLNTGYGGAARLLDSAVAVLLVALAFRLPLKHGRSALNQILDRTLDEDMQLKLLGVVSENLHNFCEFRSIRSRQSGRDIFIEMDVVMPFDYTLEDAYALERQIEVPVNELYPSAIFRMYVTPCPRDCIREGVCFCPVKNVRNK